MVKNMLHQMVSTPVLQPCKYKIGISAIPWNRWWYQYFGQGYVGMMVLYTSMYLEEIKEMEIDLIDELRFLTSGTQQCVNIHDGGNGRMHTKLPPYFVYGVVSNGDIEEELVSGRAHFDPKDSAHKGH